VCFTNNSWAYKQNNFFEQAQYGVQLISFYVLKISCQQNSVKSSWADSCIRHFTYTVVVPWLSGLHWRSIWESWPPRKNSVEYVNIWNIQLPLHLLERVHLASCCETYQESIFPLNGLWAHSRVSPVVGLLPLSFGQPCFGKAFLPSKVKLHKTKILYQTVDSGGGGEYGNDDDDDNNDNDDNRF